MIRRDVAVYVNSGLVKVVEAVALVETDRRNIGGRFLPKVNVSVE